MPKTAPEPSKKPRGRPRLTADALESRIEAYCKRYKVAPDDRGLPPFPTGKRETAQHRQWIALYNAHKRLARREASAGLSPEALAGLLEAQKGSCPVCDLAITAQDGAVDLVHGKPRGVLHPKCRDLAAAARALGGSGMLSHLKTYLGD